MKATICLLLLVAVVAYAFPQDIADDPGFGNGQGQGGFPSQDDIVPDPGFGDGQGNGGQGEDIDSGFGQPSGSPWERN